MSNVDIFSLPRLSSIIRTNVRSKWSSRDVGKVRDVLTMTCGEELRSARVGAGQHRGFCSTRARGDTRTYIITRVSNNARMCNISACKNTRAYSDTHDFSHICAWSACVACTDTSAFSVTYVYTNTRECEDTRTCTNTRVQTDTRDRSQICARDKRRACAGRAAWLVVALQQPLRVPLVRHWDAIKRRKASISIELEVDGRFRRGTAVAQVIIRRMQLPIQVRFGSAAGDLRHGSEHGL